MTAKNDITGDLISSKEVTDAFRESYDRIFGKKTDLTVVAKQIAFAKVPSEEMKLSDDEEGNTCD